MTNQSNKKILKWSKVILAVLLILIAGFLAFVLNETKDEVNATPENIEEQMSSFYNPKKMGGFSVAVFNADSVIYSGGFGFANVEKQIPYTKKTEQHIASISKTSIGIALMKAEELGLLTIDDPINKHLPFSISNPNFPTAEITLKQLATHTSSLDYNEAVVESLYIEASEEHESLEAFMNDYFKNGKYGQVAYTNHAPGAHWNYSNIGASLAAYIIERASGMSFSAFSKQYIFDAIGLEHTSWFKSSGDTTKHTSYYEHGEDSLVEVATSGVKLYPSRDMVTTIEDLTAYCQALISRNPQLLTAASFEKLLGFQVAGNVTDQTVDNCGLFFMIDRNQYGITYQLTGMNGGDNCINTMMWFDPVTELGYIFIGNTGQSKRNRVNHIWAYRALVSLGDYVLMENASLSDQVIYKWHNLYNRVRGLF